MDRDHPNERIDELVGSDWGTKSAEAVLSDIHEMVDLVRADGVAPESIAMPEWLYLALLDNMGPTFDHRGTRMTDLGMAFRLKRHVETSFMRACDEAWQRRTFEDPSPTVDVAKREIVSGLMKRKVGGFGSMMVDAAIARLFATGVHLPAAQEYAIARRMKVGAFRSGLGA